MASANDYLPSIEEAEAASKSLQKGETFDDGTVRIEVNTGGGVTIYVSRDQQNLFDDLCVIAMGRSRLDTVAKCTPIVGDWEVSYSAR